MLSIDFTGTHSGQFGVGEPFVISADGRFAAFRASSTNHVANDTNFSADVFVHDANLRRHIWDTTYALSAPSAAGSPGSSPWAFTPDGRYLVFVSTATNLVPGVIFSRILDYQLYVQDLLSNVTTLVSVAYDGTNVADRSMNSFPGKNRMISTDGRFVAFASIATNLVDLTDVNGAGSDIFCRDLVTASTELITLPPNGGRTLDASTFTCGFNPVAHGRRDNREIIERTSPAEPRAI